MCSSSQKIVSPRVSVVVTTRNRPTLVERAIRSVLSQTYKNFDLHIVDDASYDETRQVVESVMTGYENCHYWRHQERKGLSAARNTGIAKSTGQYIAFLDDDDEWKPQCVEKRVDLLLKLGPENREKLGVVYCGCEIHIDHQKHIFLNLPRIEGNIKESICRQDLSTIPSSCLFPRQILKKIGGFDETLSSCIDHDIWMSLAKHGYHAYAVKEPLVVTYDVKKRKSMVTDTIQRIKGVEQYLHKWASTFEQWLGQKNSRYISRYRTRVLGYLAATKICEGSFHQAWHLITHIFSQNHFSPIESAFLMRLIGHKVLKMCIPEKFIDKLKNDWILQSIKK